MVESNPNRLSSCKVSASERLVDYEHLRRIVPFTIVEQTSLFQFHSSRREERGRHHAVIGNSFFSLPAIRLACDRKWQLHSAAAGRQVRERANRSHAQ